MRVGARRAAGLPHMLLLLACTAHALRVGVGSTMSSRRAALVGAVGAILPTAASASVSANFFIAFMT